MDWASFFICFTGWTLGGIVNGISGLGADIFARGLCLPSDNKITPEEQDQIIEIIRGCFE